MFSNSSKLNRCVKIGRICKTAHGPSPIIVMGVSPFQGMPWLVPKGLCHRGSGRNQNPGYPLLKGAKSLLTDFPFYKSRLTWPFLSYPLTCKFLLFIDLCELFGWSTPSDLQAQQFIHTQLVSLSQIYCFFPALQRFMLIFLYETYLNGKIKMTH